MRLIFATLLLFFACGCASIFSRNENIAVDSHPRNVTILDKKTKSSRQTPFVKEYRRQNTLTLFSEHDGEQRKHLYACSFRWVDSGVGNAVLSLFAGLPFGPLLFAASLGLDLMSGAAYECPERITLDLGPPKSSGPDICRSYLILPPQNASSRLSDEVAYRGRQYLSTRLKACDAILARKDVGEVFRRFQINYETEDRDFPQLYYNYWAVELGANTIVDFKIQDRGSTISVTPSYLDIYSHETKLDPPFLIKKGEMRVFSDTNFKAKDIVARFIPNFVAFGPDGVSATFEGRNGYTIKSEKRRGVPVFVELSSRSDLSSFENWKFSSSWGVNYPIFYERFHLDLEKKDNPADVYETNWTFFRVMAEVYGRGSMHTPVGSFSLALGIAPAYVYTRSSEHVIQNGLYVTPVAHIAYEAFIGRAFYFFLELQSYFNTESVADDYAKHNGLVRSLLGIGYLIPSGLFDF